MDKTQKQIESEYKSSIADTGGRCWRCGRTANQRPPWYHAPWFLHRHHIVSKPRKNDRRAVVVLCPACHDRQHLGPCSADPREELTLDGMLWMKHTHDADFFDPEFLASCSIKPALVLSICREIMESGKAS